MFTKRQNEIIDAALEMAAEKGLTYVTMKRIAQKLQITEPALYRHFSGKSEIIQALVQRFDVEVPISDTLHGFEGIETFLRGRVAQVKRCPALANLMFSEALFVNEPECEELLMELMHRHKTGMTRLFTEAQTYGEIRPELEHKVLFRLIFGPIRLLIKQWGMTGHAFSLEKDASDLINALRILLKPSEK